MRDDGIADHAETPVELFWASMVGCKVVDFADSVFDLMWTPDRVQSVYYYGAGRGVGSLALLQALPEVNNAAWHARARGSRKSRCWL